MSLRHMLPSCAKVRLAIAVLSFIGFVVFLVASLRPPPSTLIPSLPHTGHKLSVVLLPSSTNSNLTHFVLHASLPILAADVKAEFIVVAGTGKSAVLAVKPLRDKGYHVELTPPQTSLMHTLSEAFNRAHFSQILVYGDDRVPMSQVISELVQPVIGGRYDMTITEYSDKSLLLSLFSYPITGHLSSTSNTTVFSFHTAIWHKDCHDVSLTAASPSLELIAKCDLDSFSSTSLSFPSPHQDHLKILAQVHLLYWQLHPIWCTLLSLACVAVLLTLWRAWRRNSVAQKGQNSRTLRVVIA